MSYLQFQERFIETPWGGSDWEMVLKKTPPFGTQGICEIAVDEPDHSSLIVDGPYSGMHLREALERDAERIVGPRWPQKKLLPCGIRWVNVAEQQRLPLVFLMNSMTAQRLGSAENRRFWINFWASASAELLSGLPSSVASSSLPELLRQNGLEYTLYRQPFPEDSAVQVASGSCVSVSGGALFLDIFENTSGMVALERRDEKWGRWISEDIFSFLPSKLLPSELIPPHMRLDYPAPPFRLRKQILDKGDEWTFKAQGQMRFLVVKSGKLLLNLQKSLASGDVLLLCYAWMNTIRAEEKSEIILIDEFANVSNIFSR